ncbi:MAG: hypothetical protein ACOC9J_02060 [Persicimonas sp.]
MVEILVFIIFFFVIGALCVGGTVLPIALLVHQRSRTANLWEQDAQTLGLEVAHRRGKGLEGHYGGCHLYVRNISRTDYSPLSRNNARISFTVVELKLEHPATRQIVVETKGLADKVSTLFGGPDIETGQRHFDRALRVQAADADAARAFLGREGVVDAFNHLHVLSHKLVLRGGTIKVEVKEVHHGEDLRALLDRITHAVSIIDGSASSAKW